MEQNKQTVNQFTDKRLRLLELFSGYGGASFALRKANIPFECVGHSEIDKYAIQCFNNNFPNIKNFGDCKTINPNELPDFDLLTGGFPCQAFSLAGKMQGESDPRGTLFYDIIRIAEVKKPKYMLLENVKGLTAKKFKSTFDTILNELNRIGYNVYWKVLNSKDYGIPQSRARVWFVCFRKDIDIPFMFQFPEPVELKIFIKDILEDNVDSKYYLSEKLQERFKKYLEEKQLKEIPTISSPYGGYKSKDTCGTLGAGCGISASKTNYVINNPNKGGDGKVLEKEGISNCLEGGTSGGGGTSNRPMVYDKLVIDGYIGERFGSCNTILSKESISQTLSESMGLGGGYVPKIYDRKGFDSRTKGFRENELSPTLSTKMGTGGNNVPMVSNAITTAVGRIGHSNEELKIIENNMNCGQLRRLTPKECFRLMGFLNDEINLNGLSDTQRYKLAGNGWEINVASLILRNILKPYLEQQRLN